MTPLIGVCDYGVGNLRSVERALRASGAETVISDQPGRIGACDGVVLPGVGAFAIAARALHGGGLGDTVRDMAAAGKPLLGICLGHQLLFESSDEGPDVGGLGLLEGRVTRLRARDGLKVPHMGWNTLTTVVSESRLLEGTSSGEYMYFVHSFAAIPANADVAATTEYGEPIAAAVEHDNIMGTQFHPEKSGAPGRRLYANFVAMCSERHRRRR